MNGQLRPAIVTVDKDRVQVLDLVDVDGILAVPADRGYRYIGDVYQDRVEKDGLSVKRWFASTLVGSTIGPVASKRVAVDELLHWNHIRSADVSETSSPLF